MTKTKAARSDTLEGEEEESESLNNEISGEKNKSLLLSSYSIWSEMNLSLSLSKGNVTLNFHDVNLD